MNDHEATVRRASRPIRLTVLKKNISRKVAVTLPEFSFCFSKNEL